MHRLNKLIDGGHRPRLLVLGDLILDRYTWGNAGRISPEAPVLVLNAREQELRPGGAASVAALLCGLDAEVVPVGVIGDDTAGRQLTRLLEELDLDSTMLVQDRDRPTTTKERFMGRAAGRHPHQILRVDHESADAVDADVENQLLGHVVGELRRCDALLISDYAKGVCTPRVLEEAIQAASRRQVPVIVDPGRVTGFSRYSGADVITPNRTEGQLASGKMIATPQDALAVAKPLRRRNSIGAVVVTLDRDGMVVASQDFCEHLPTRPRPVYDITGAGDMVLAVIGLCRAAGIELREAAQLANVAAGLEVERLGVAPVSRQEIMAELNTTAQEHSPTDDKLVTLQEMTAQAARYRREGKRVVFTNGCFDLLHVGHVRCLQAAAQPNGVLVVGVNCDAVVTRLKGPGRPVINQQDRAAMLAALSCVDHVLIFEEKTPHRLLHQIRPDVLVKGGTTDEVVGREVVEAYGGRVCHTELVHGVSTTEILTATAK